MVPFSSLPTAYAEYRTVVGPGIFTGKQRVAKTKVEGHELISATTAQGNEGALKVAKISCCDGM